jgi:hypothetical protein
MNLLVRFGIGILKNITLCIKQAMPRGRDMSRNHTAEEVRAAKRAAMPGDLGELHYLLWNEVAWLHMKWKDYRALFASSSGRTIELLNQAAPVFFRHLQDTLWEDILLHICRLTDPPETMGHANLTLRRLCPLVAEPQLRAEVEALTREAKKKSDFARDWRNRHLAHKALPPLDGSSSTPLATASRQHVEEALEAIRIVMNRIESHYENGTVAYEHCLESPQGVASLLYFIEKGLAAQKREDEALLSRRSRPETDQ